VAPARLEGDSLRRDRRHVTAFPPNRATVASRLTSSRSPPQIWSASRGPNYFFFPFT
jgi:hypothetical protein